MEYLARGSLYEYLQRQRRRSASKREMAVAQEEVPLIEPLSKAGTEGGNGIPVVRGMLRSAPEKTPELTEVRTAAQLRHPSQCVCRPYAAHADLPLLSSNVAGRSRHKLR